MKTTKHILIAGLALFASCTEVITIIQAPETPGTEDGNAHEVIVLNAGVVGNSEKMTRAVTTSSDPHLAFTTGTAMALRVDGKWFEKNFSNDLVTKTTTGTTSNANAVIDNSNDKCPVTLSPVLYWDDYGTADPNNTGTTQDPKGREIGLTIYGAAVNGVTTTPTVNSWTALSWNVGTATNDVIDQSVTDYWKNKDLLVSNNIKENTQDSENVGTYKWANRSTGKRLDFTHAMTKITVVLTAGDGFGSANGGADGDKKFSATPTVTLLGFNYTGTVNIETKEEPSPTASATANIKAHLISGGANNASATYDALVFPGNAFNATSEVYPNILEVVADGNKYLVTSEKLIAAINTAISENAGYNFPANDHALKQGWNYQLKIKINKTKIDVSATIVNWNTVEAEEVDPQINVNATYGTAATSSSTLSALDKDFTFLRSTSVDGNFLAEKFKDNNNNDIFAKVKYSTSSSGNVYTLSPSLYWPNHNTHYFFRGVWPIIDETGTGVKTTETATVKNDNASKNTYIDIKNVKYEEGKYPSDLMIGAPCDNDGKISETCKVGEHNSASGICATEGNITLNFKYMMSQVEVILSTSGNTDLDHVNVNKSTKVELINVANNGTVALKDRNVTAAAKSTTESENIYTLDPVDGNGNELKRHSAIVPQDLESIRFKITVYQGDGTTIDDIYYADVKDILKKGTSTNEKVAPNGKWESGVHYKYELMITKTDIKIVATITNWTEVNGSQNIWF